MNINAADNPFVPVAARSVSPFRQQQVMTIGTMYAGYAVSMVLRMIPTVAGTSIRADASLGVDLESWGRILAAGTCGAMTGKFLCGWAADKFGGKRTFTVGLFAASLFVAVFAMSSSVLMFQFSFFFTLMAQAAGWPSMTKIITNWIPPKKYGEVWGILSTSSRVGTLTATFLLGSLLSWMSWRGMLWIASGTGFLIMIFYAVAMRERPLSDVADGDQPADPDQSAAATARPIHPLDGFTLPQAMPHIFFSIRFWLISGSLMGLTILWDFLLIVPMYLQDTLRLETAQASRAASAFPLGSLISVLIGGFVFDRLNRYVMAWVMAGMLTAATGCLLVFAILPQWHLTGPGAMAAALVLLFIFGLCLSPCYYIPCSVFSIAFGGKHSGFLVAILDAVGFAATATFYYFGGGIARSYGWTSFLFVLSGVCLWSLLTTFLFMRREARVLQQEAAAA